MISLANLARPLSCYTADIEQDGQRMTIDHICGDPDCPGLS
jgi:hypothetical protein